VVEVSDVLVVELVDVEIDVLELVVVVDVVVVIEVVVMGIRNS